MVLPGDALSIAALQKEAAALAAAIERFPSLVEEFLKASKYREVQLGRDVGYGVDFVRLVRKRRDFRGSTLKRLAEHILKYDSTRLD